MALTNLLPPAGKLPLEQPHAFDLLPTRTPFTAIAVMVGAIIAEPRSAKQLLNLQ